MTTQNAIDQLRDMLEQLRDIRRDGLLDSDAENAAYRELFNAQVSIRTAINHLVIHQGGHPEL